MTAIAGRTNSSPGMPSGTIQLTSERPMTNQIHQGILIMTPLYKYKESNGIIQANPN